MSQQPSFREEEDDQELVPAASSTKEDTSVSGNFDAEGFGGYLAPYAVAVIVSVAVTAAFFKFVLLDY